MALMEQPVVFLDKDGTLIRDVPYNVDPRRMEFTPGAVSGLRRLHEAGLRFVVVSNQAGVARGYFPEEALLRVESHLREMLLKAAGVSLDGFYYCPHHPDGTVAKYAVQCACRKPAPGLLFRAAQDLDVSLSASWMIGDILHDVEAGSRAGCRTILLDTGSETEWQPGPHRTPDFITGGLDGAAEIILTALRMVSAHAGPSSFLG